MLTIFFSTPDIGRFSRRSSMENFAYDAKTRAAIAAARGEVASHFWRSLAGLFRRHG
jgi:hypothetical protein